MLSKLLVENYALIERLEMRLDSSLNIITGETGAGKSILLGALALLLGAKNDGAATKDNTKSCIVEGRFQIGQLGLQELFEHFDWDYDEEVTIRRVISAAGKSRAFVGDIPVPLSDLKVLGAKLIDIHSQHQNMILTDEEFRISSLDLLFDSAPLLKEYQAEFARLGALRQELSRTVELIQNARRDESWLSHQVEELSSAQLIEGELAEAEAEFKILENVEQIGLTLSALSQRLDGEEGVLTQLKGSEKELSQIVDCYPAAAEYAARLRSVNEEIKDIARSLSFELDEVEADPLRLAKVGERIDLIYGLLQKHRVSILSDLIALRDDYADQLSRIESSDEELERLQREIEDCEQRALEMANELSARRKAVADDFAHNIHSTLSRLGMERSRFAVVVERAKALNSKGINTVSFLFSSVEGKSMQAVERIASGGELSRVMLALKVLLAKRMNLPTIIFDEIDTGVSGRIADAMGEIIEELSLSMQVVDITHLPQVASKGKTHFVVFREESHTSLRLLSDEERDEQIAMMLSGNQVTASAIDQARILLKRNQ